MATTQRIKAGVCSKSRYQQSCVFRTSNRSVVFLLETQCSMRKTQNIDLRNPSGDYQGIWFLICCLIVRHLKLDYARYFRITLSCGCLIVDFTKICIRNHDSISTPTSITFERWTRQPGKHMGTSFRCSASISLTSLLNRTIRVHVSQSEKFTGWRYGS